MIKRLLIHVEGQTEETFVKELLSPHLSKFGVGASARLLGNARQRNNRGGIRGWPETKRDVTNHLKSDVQCISTMMVDYYGMPQEGAKAWPGRAAAHVVPFDQKANTVQTALHTDLQEAMGDGFDPMRFIPFVLMHEFEGLLFSECNQFATGIGRPTLGQDFQIIRDAFQTPEEINDSPMTAPSKRITQLVPGYEKPFLGVLAALEIGLASIRAECPNFAAWLHRLEQLGQ